MNSKSVTENKFSIVIPTRERAETLYWSLKTCIEQDYENLRIIVSDNYSQDNTRDVVTSFADKRIKYINTGQRVDMSVNWEFALSHLINEDGYVIYIGDDDALMFDAVRNANHILNLNQLDGIIWRLAIYNWPDFPVRHYAHRMVIPFGQNLFVHDSQRRLRDYYKRRLPIQGLLNLYQNSFVSIPLIKRVKNLFGGHFFRSPTPDIYSSILLSKYAERVAYSEAPFSWIGSSAQSNCGSVSALIEQGEIQGELNKYWSEIKTIKFSPRMPVTQILLSSVIGEAILKAEEQPGSLKIEPRKERKLVRFILENMILDLQIAHPDVYQEGFETISQLSRMYGLTEFARALINRTPRAWDNSLNVWLKGYSSQHRTFDLDGSDFNVHNIYDAARFASKLFNYPAHLRWYEHQKLSRSLVYIGRKIARAAEKLYGRPICALHPSTPPQSELIGKLSEDSYQSLG